MFGLILAAALTATSAGSDRSLRAVVQDHFRGSPDDSKVRYVKAFVDLNGDGRKEAFVYVSGDGMCGSGGCPLVLYTPHGKSWRRVQGWVVVWPPVRLLKGRSHGWRNFSVFVAGGGIIPGYEAEMRFDGRAYPSNVTMPPARRIHGAALGQTLIKRNDAGHPLY